MNEYHRTITTFLRDHGAHDVKIVPGGRHPHVDFTFRDKKFNLAVHRDPPGHSDAAIIKVKELRGLLGEPDVAATGERRSLGDMTPRTNGHAKTSAGGIALYGGVGEKLRLRLFPPADVAAFLGARVVRTQRMAKDQWLLTPTDDATGRRLRADGKKWQLDAGYGEELTRGYESPFGASPAEYVVVDDHVVVRLLTDQVRPVEKRQPKRPKTNPVRGAEPATREAEVQSDAAGRTAGATPATGAVQIGSDANGVPGSDPTLADPRAVLAAISKVEASTPYRLVRLKDDRGWAWQAPMIKLDGGC